MSSPHVRSRPESGPASMALLGLIKRTGDRLVEEGLAHCLWKGEGESARWGSGGGDIDLLVGDGSWPSLRSLLGELGFREAGSTSSVDPDTRHCFGVDPATGKLVHLHIYHRLVLGRPWKAQYRLPLEEAMLTSATPGQVFAEPAPELSELARLMDAVAKLGVRGIFRGQQRRRERLKIEPNRIADVAGRHGVSVDLRLVSRLSRAMLSDSTVRERWTAPRELRRVLGPPFRRPSLRSRLAGLRSAVLSTRRRHTRGMPLVAGGRVVALIGGDGAGKSTAATELVRWLKPHVAVEHAHIGRPPRGVLTIGAGGLLKVIRSLNQASGDRTTSMYSLSAAVRALATARDRRRLVHKAHMWAEEGRVVIAERYPVDGNEVLVGPAVPSTLTPSVAATPVGRWLMRKESGLYQKLPPPDAAFVLRVDPEEAVRRKVNEPADYVEVRNRAIAAVDWQARGATVVDANLPAGEVLWRLKQGIWKAL